MDNGNGTDAQGRSAQNDNRREPLDWDNYFMTIAHAVKAKSKDPRCQVGAVIVSPDRLVTATGFNGFPRGVNDHPQALDNTVVKLEWIVHAEKNAIFNAARAGVRTHGCSLYVTKFPCFDCARAIVQCGITRLYTDDSKFWDEDPIDADHQGKEHVLRCGNVQVVAPNHRDFGRPPHLRSVRRTSAPPSTPPDSKKASGY